MLPIFIAHPTGTMSRAEFICFLLWIKLTSHCNHMFTCNSILAKHHPSFPLLSIFFTHNILTVNLINFFKKNTAFSIRYRNPIHQSLLWLKYCSIFEGCKKATSEDYTACKSFKPWKGKRLGKKLQTLKTT